MPQTWPMGEDVPQRLRVRWPTRYEWGPAERWVGWLRQRLAARLAVKPAEIAQPYEGMVLFELDLDGVSHEVAIDYFDRDRVLDEVVERCPLVFKMQYRLEGYGHPHVVPGGYVPPHPHLYPYLPALRRLRDRSPSQVDIYGRFGAALGAEVREAAVELLRAQHEFSYKGGLELAPYATYLRECARSLVCIDLPGNGDLCHRLVDYLAIGCCIVRPAPKTRLHVRLTDGLNITYVRPDLSDLLSVCADLAADPPRSVELGRAAREYFDRYLHSDQLTGYYINQCMSIGGRA